MAWTGNSQNPVPNVTQEADNRSDVRKDVNRAHETRRDNDVQKDPTITLLDIDTTIMKQLEKFNLTVVDQGNIIKVPVHYASPDKWKSIQKDGVIRDYNGKMILPAMALKRTTSDKDQALMMFNRFLRYPVIKRYSTKNKYTQFSTLVPQNAPINEVYDVVIPDHMIFTYHFIIWTESNEQMNTLVEKINFETEDYWGEERGMRFRTELKSFSHTLELQIDQDRIVKTEFDLLVHGYLLPDTMNTLKRTVPTTTKWLTPKKIIMGMEVVATGFNLEELDKNRENLRNLQYPNLQKDVVIPTPPVVMDRGVLLSAPTPPGLPAIPFWHFPTPTSSSDTGQPGWVSYDNNYYYLYTGGQWLRIPISTFADIAVIPPSQPELINFYYIDAEYYYIYTQQNQWKRVPLVLFVSFTIF